MLRPLKNKMKSEWCYVHWACNLWTCVVHAVFNSLEWWRYFHSWARTKYVKYDWNSIDSSEITYIHSRATIKSIGAIRRSHFIHWKRDGERISQLNFFFFCHLFFHHILAQKRNPGTSMLIHGASYCSYLKWFHYPKVKILNWTKYAALLPVATKLINTPSLHCSMLIPNTTVWIVDH